MLFELSKATHSELALKEMIVNEFFPEYKYSFIFRGFSEKWMGKNVALHTQSLFAALSPSTEQVRQDIQSMLDSMDERWIRYNKYFLTQFLSYCRSQSMKIIIVEGQYNPLAYTEKSRHLNRMVNNELQSIAQEFDNVTFLPRLAITEFTQDDYSDVTHVTRKPAYRFVENLIQSIHRTAMHSG